MKVETNSMIDIARQTAGPIPDLPFDIFREKILGKQYQLSVLFPNTKTSCELHLTYKNKPDPVNVLSFPLSDSGGEIIITLGKARKEAKLYGRTYLEHVMALYIHALVHLKGYDHGDEMEKLEEKWNNYYLKHYYK